VFDLCIVSFFRFVVVIKRTLLGSKEIVSTRSGCEFKAKVYSIELSKMDRLFPFIGGT
jgi:hypothetical protein